MLPLSCSFYRSHIVLDYFLVSTWEIAREGVLQDLLENASWRKNRSFLETSIDWFGLAFGLLLVSPYSYSSIALTYFQSANYRSLELRSMWENLLVEGTHPFFVSTGLYPATRFDFLWARSFIQEVLVQKFYRKRTRLSWFGMRIVPKETSFRKSFLHKEIGSPRSF